MNEGGEKSQSQGVVKDFALRMASKPKKQAQLDLGGDDSGLDELFKPEPSKHKLDKDIDLDDKITDDLGGEMDDIEKSELDEIKEHIDTAGLSVEDLDDLADYVTEKRVDLTEDDIDTEMDRDEAEEKDHMRKDDEPLGGEGNAAMGYGGGSGGMGGDTAPKATGTPM
jgi:hypothetical protein